MKTPILLLIAALCLNAQAAEFHVAPGGSDSNPGTAAKPFAIVEKALAAARAARKSAPGEATTILLHGGEYPLLEPLTLVPEDSGSPGKPLTITAAPGGVPVLTSARGITGWKPADANTPGLAPGALGKVWVADIPKGWRFHFLYADGAAMPVARMHKSENFHDWPRVAKVGPVEPGGQLLGVSKGVLDNLPDNGDVEMNLIPVQWWNSLSVIRGFDREAGTLRRHSKSPTVCDYKDRFISGGGAYNLQNALKFLTQPGEWAVDSTAGKVYFWPPSGSPAAMKITAPTATRLLEIKGDPLGKSTVHDVTIRGLHFTCTDRLPEDQWPDAWVKRQAELPDGMIAIEGAENCVIDSCTITHSGSYAIAFQNFARANKVTRNEMGWLGCGGVLLQGFGPGTTDVSKGNVIQRNYIHHTGNGGFMHSAAVTLFQSNSNDISLNWLDNLPYAAVQIVGCHTKEFGTGNECKIWDSYGNNEAMYKTRYEELPKGRDTFLDRTEIKKYLFSGNNRIADNIISNYMTKLGDGGALYCWGCGLGNVWEGNLLKRTITRPGEHLIIAIYMDDEVDGATIRNNICWHKGNAYDTLNKGANKWESNVIQATKPAGYDARLQELAEAARAAGGWLNTPADQSLVISGQDKFIGTTTVAITSLIPGTIRYTTDGSVPTVASPAYTAPFVLDSGATVRAVVIDKSGKVQLSGDQLFTKVVPRNLAPGTMVKAEEVMTLEGPRLDDKKNIGWCDNGGAFAFGPFEFSGAAKSIELTLGIDPKYAGGKIHVRLDSRTGPEIAMHQCTSTGGFESLKPHLVPFTTPPTGTHTLWFVLDGGPGICNFGGFRLMAP